jgi:exodeoxyribonuclease V beta subunit
MSRELDAVSTELQSGFTLIEASAGTGKTTTISAIILRLLVEHEIAIERILVATYTELATAELRGRIRAVINNALDVLRGGKANLPFVGEIMAAKPKETARLLETALQNFDEAAIFTIHGFCARILADRAFESGALFDLELTTDQSNLLHEIVDDFWRANFYGDDLLLMNLLRTRLKPAHFLTLLQELTTNPALRVLPEPTPSSHLKEQLAQIWARSGDCDELHATANQIVVSLQGEFCLWARAELARRKSDRRLQSFDDMLTRLDLALRSERGSALRESLRARFTAALIDEFQDTDPIQYSILSQIYGGSNARVFFIGDPKQAIYGFRGADVFAYLEAAKDARRYTLGKNWRSDAGLVEGVRSIFSRKENAFVIPGIELPRVKAARPRESSEPPLRFWMSTEPKKVASAVAGEIARLLDSKARLAGEDITPKRIAILVNNNSQPGAFQRALAQSGISSVVYSAANVFKSEEAKELGRVLLALAQPSREKLVRTALATELLGFTAQKLEALGDPSLEEIFNRFAEYYALWREKGFVEMMRILLVREKVRTRLLALRDGERRLTNVLHLIELLHAACAENHLGLDGVITWLRRQRSGEGREEYELRLESDEDAVRIVTIHKSKGLEYDITFYPFARKEPWHGNELVKFHDGNELVLDLERGEASKTLRAREDLAELVRQLYVALTRARHRSYVVWQEGKKRGSRTALNWLYGPETSAEKFAICGGVNAAPAAVAEFVSGKVIAVAEMPEAVLTSRRRTPEAEQKFEPRIFTGVIDRGWGMVSFSSLASGRTEEVETPDYDSVETPLETEPLASAQGIHAFPGGMRAGTCLHKILEEIDFTDPGSITPLVKTKLELFRISGFDEVVTETIARVLRTPLGVSGFCLASIRQRLPELEFTFAIDAVRAPQLQALFAESDFPAAIGRLQFQPARGFVKGFIDLVFEHEGKFYFVDWKSNWLGPDASFYNSESLAGAMAANFYTLQLSIYALALHRFLRSRLPGYDYEKNFGGAFYLFLRGLENNGVFSSRPSFDFIEKLDRTFGHGKR